MQLRGPLVGPDRWWYHTLLKGTVRETLASYGSVPESGPPLSFDQRVLEPNRYAPNSNHSPFFGFRGSAVFNEKFYTIGLGGCLIEGKAFAFSSIIGVKVPNNQRVDHILL